MGFEWLMGGNKDAEQVPAAEQDTSFTQTYTEAVAKAGFVIEEETDLREDIKYRIYLRNADRTELSEDQLQTAHREISSAYTDEGIEVLIAVEDFTQKHIAIEPLADSEEDKSATIH